MHVRGLGMAMVQQREHGGTDKGARWPKEGGGSARVWARRGNIWRAVAGGFQLRKGKGVVGPG